MGQRVKKLIVIGSLFFYLDTAIATNGNVGILEPLFPIFETKKMPMVEFIIMDDKLRGRLQKMNPKPQTSDDLEELADDIDPENPKVAGSYLILYREHLRHSYYLQNRLHSERLSTKKKKQLTRDWKRHLRKIEKFANRFAKTTKRKKRKASALYYAYTSAYLLGKSEKKQISKLKNLAKKLPSHLFHRVHFLDTLHAPMQSRLKSVSNISKLQNKFGLMGHILTNLLTARLLAGVDETGNRRSKPHKKSVEYLSKANHLAKQLDANKRQKILTYSIFLWQVLQPDKNRGWDSFPLNIDNPENNLVHRGIEERKALTQLAQGHYFEAVKKYKAFRNYNLSIHTKLSLDKRLLEIAKQNAKSTGNVADLEKTFISAIKKYQNTNVFGKKNVKFVENSYSNFYQSYHTWIKKNLAIAEKSQKRDFLDQTVLLTNNFLKMNMTVQTRRDLHQDLAALHEKIGNSSEAVALYLKLASGKQENQTPNFLRKAIYLQHKLASWPSEPVWKLLPQKSVEARKKLLSIYQMHHERNKNQPQWPILSVHGRLAFNLGKKTEAFALWSQGFKNLKNTKQTNFAAGFMLSDLYEEKKWNFFIDYAHLIATQKIQPTTHSGVFPLRTALGNALNIAGERAYLNKRYKISTKYLDEFQSKYPNDSRRPQTLFLLADSLHHIKQYSQAVSTLEHLAKEYPDKNPNRKETLILGGEWALDISRDESAGVFYQEFLRNYSKDAKAPIIRLTLASLHKAKERWGDATDIYQKHSDDDRVEEKERMDSLRQVLEINNRYGDSKEVMRAIHKILALEHAPPSLLGSALTILSRLAFEDQKIPNLQSIEKRLLANSRKNHPAMQEALGNIRYYLALLTYKNPVDDIQLVSLKEPRKTIASIHEKYLRYQKTFELVCANGTSTRCAPALLKFSNISKNWLKLVEKVQVADTLNKKDFDSFQKFRQKFIEKINSVSKKFTEKSLVLVENGTTTPKWAIQILKSKHSLAGSPAQEQFVDGYVQWKIESVPLAR